MSKVEDLSLKTVILGEPSVGKTSLRRVYLGETFEKSYIETVGSDFSHKQIDIDGKPANFNLWDLAGQVEFRHIHPMYYRNSAGAILVYDITNRESFDTIKDWLQSFFKHNGYHGNPALIIRNKEDLAEKFTSIVDLDEHKALLKDLREIYPDSEIIDAYTSAKTGENVVKAFETFAKLCYDWYQNAAAQDSWKKSVNKDYQENFPAAMIMTMNQVAGPLLVTSTLEFDSMNLEQKSKIMTAVIKLIASLDFEDVITNGSVNGAVPWSQPQGILYYVAFTIDSPKVRGNKELYIISLLAKRELQEPIDGIKGMINGFLHSSLNNFARFRLINKIDFITKQYEHGYPSLDLTELIENLDKLRQKAQKSLEAWFSVD